MKKPKIIKDKQEPLIDVMISLRARQLAKRIAHGVWGKYSNRFGYKLNKQSRNDRVDPHDINSMVFYFGQFDVTDQLEFVEILSEIDNPKLTTELFTWIKQYQEWYSMGDDVDELMTDEKKDLTKAKEIVNKKI